MTTISLRSEAQVQARQGQDQDTSGTVVTTDSGSGARQAFLVLLSERFGDRVFPLVRETVTTIGRSPERHVQIPDGLVSGLHAEVFERDGAWLVRDAGSKNGTRVNGVATKGEVPLKPNDRVELGGAATFFFTDRRFNPDTGRQKQKPIASAAHELTVTKPGATPLPPASAAASAMPAAPAMPVGQVSGATPMSAGEERATGTSRYVNPNATNILRVVPIGADVPRGPGAGAASGPARAPRSTITVPQAEVHEAMRIARPARVEGGLEARSIALLYQLAEALGAARTEKDLLERALDLTLALIPGDRAYAIVLDPKAPADGEIPVPAVIRRRPGFPGADTVAISTTIIDAVLRDRSAVATNDAGLDARFSGAESVVRHEIHAVMAAPLLVQDRVLGIFYLEATAPGYMFHRSELMLLSAIAFQAALALEGVRSVAALEARVAERAGEIERLSSERAQLLSIAAHDVKTPLAGMLGYLECILPRAQETPGAEWIAGELDVVIEAARGIMDLLNDLLDRQKVEAGKIELAPEPTELRGFLEAAMPIYQRWAEGVGRRVELGVEERLPVVPIDRRRVTQILNNLVHNALKYTPRGTAIRIEARSQKAPDLVEISVTDQGRGFDGSDTDKILACFVRGTKSETTPIGQGHGLGLHIVKKLVELHGGVLEIDGRPGRGARFAVRLPVNQPTPVPGLWR